MRTLLASALVLAAACGPADQSASASHDAPSAAQSRGSDHLILRVERAGGSARVHLYPAIDSAVWSAGGAPAIERFLGFDPEQGVIGFVDTRGVPGRVDLRLGDVARASGKLVLTGARSANGSSIYGVAGRDVVRYTAAGRWELSAVQAVGSVFPQSDGSLVAMSRRRGDAATFWRVFPPERRVLDTASLTGLAAGPHLQGGDRLYLATREGFAVLRARTLEAEPPIELDAEPEDAVATPSGDRLLITIEGAPELHVYDRYRRQLGEPVQLPGVATSLRIDPLGRYVLVRPAVGDSVWVIALGTLRRTGTIRSAWRAAQPVVAHPRPQPPPRAPPTTAPSPPLAGTTWRSWMARRSERRSELLVAHATCGTPSSGAASGLARPGSIARSSSTWG